MCVCVCVGGGGGGGVNVLVNKIMMGILIPNRQHKEAHHLVSLVRLVFDERREQLEHGLSLHTHHTHLVCIS